MGAMVKIAPGSNPKQFTFSIYNLILTSHLENDENKQKVAGFSPHLLKKITQFTLLWVIAKISTNTVPEDNTYSLPTYFSTFSF